METTAEWTLENGRKMAGTYRHDHDLVQDLNSCLDKIWHYGECIAEAEGDLLAQNKWRDLQQQELHSIRQLKQLIVERIEKGEFLEGL